MKFITDDRKYFVKAQAIISGILMQDHVVEWIASEFCRQLSIPNVDQSICKIQFTGHKMHGVFSRNFELDGYTFLSFESLINRHGLSTRDDAFIKLSTIDKMKWCAAKMSEISGISFDACMKYMLDLAVIDCLVGNVDRHTRNFGLFYNRDSGFSIAQIFDSGMGLFEHDYYRDSYETFDEAMGNVYVSPYGEDPFDMVNILKCEFDLSCYDFAHLKLPDRFPNKFSQRYLILIKDKFLEV